MILEHGTLLGAFVVGGSDQGDLRSKQAIVILDIHRWPKSCTVGASKVGVSNIEG